MSEAVNVNFGDMPESKAVRYLKEAGVHRGGEFLGMKSDVLKKKDKAGNVEQEWPYWQFSFNFPKGEYEYNYFKFATEPADVKFFPDFYENGVATRKMNAQEVINKDYETLFYFLSQLAVAQGYQFLSVRNVLQESVKKGGFDGMMQDFKLNFPPKKGALIDAKILWTNNKNKKSSFLGLPSPSSRNAIFGMHIQTQETVFLSPNEEKAGNYYSIVKMFTAPPKGTTESGASSAADDIDDLPATANTGEGVPVVSKEDLF